MRCVYRIRLYYCGSFWSCSNNPWCMCPYVSNIIYSPFQHTGINSTFAESKIHMWPVVQPDSIVNKVCVTSHQHFHTFLELWDLSGDKYTIWCGLLYPDSWYKQLAVLPTVTIRLLSRCYCTSCHFVKAQTWHASERCVAPLHKNSAWGGTSTKIKTHTFMGGWSQLRLPYLEQKKSSPLRTAKIEYYMMTCRLELFCSHAESQADL